MSIPNIANQNFIKYDIGHIIRSHSKDNNPHDNSTKVADLAFEWEDRSQLDSNADAAYTNYFATCGLNMVNIIDAATGKVMLKFNDEIVQRGCKDAFNKILWTHFNNVSIIAVAGLHGQIKLISPKIASCILRIDAHQTQIDSLLFHPRYPNILFSASFDRKIEIWKINIDDKLAQEEITNLADLQFSFEHLGTAQLTLNDKKQQQQQQQPNEHVLSMNIIEGSDFLLITTAQNNYQVKVDEMTLFGLNESDGVVGQSNDCPEVSILHFLTTKMPEKPSKPTFYANPLKIKPRIRGGHHNENNPPQEELTILINKIICYGDLLFADVLNTNSVYVLMPEYEQQLLTLRTIKIFNISEEVSQPHTGFCVFRDVDKHFMVKTTESGYFYKVEFNIDDLRMRNIMKFTLPDEYVIKLQKSMRVIAGEKNYGFFEKMKITSCATNVDYLICTTNQNLIFVWRKSTD